MPENDPLRVAVIVGSIRTDRFGPIPARWIAERARQHGSFEVDVIDLAEADLPFVLGGDDPGAPVPPQVAALSPRLAQADAFIVVTPVYNRGYPASLKNAIDWFYTEWNAKAVGFVSYGGLTGGVTSVEALRAVFNEVQATTIRNTVCFMDCHDKFDEEGNPVTPEPVNVAAKAFLEQLEWWARALRDARRVSPYVV
ncbi:NAD(P)H-dependent oxidoreductase [Streptomonospora sp. S1-112]|uniref:NAD(P)H-dependent oxidoreductase n=1 Tax=Streptomonospora mangrovi TaxID=2883123 RepID=A0A9X3SI32_9ACTN|nr:NAD(P)H-dependent oxidoreductase [Streptomonospora mangrovi]MDA0567780.1 NAD(P)H-dependent oxidoreductase [Streptomonospora mangrovi]